MALRCASLLHGAAPRVTRRQPPVCPTEARVAGYADQAKGAKWPLREPVESSQSMPKA
jgi:hypothetical protein